MSYDSDIIDRDVARMKSAHDERVHVADRAHASSIHARVRDLNDALRAAHADGLRVLLGTRDGRRGPHDPVAGDLVTAIVVRHV